ncbi:pyridoxal-dependent decarboxylase [Thraustotheca clavata]|uniref:Pyridoxal-dependent decarboxylase n=1 Tax=Thraustotheca clavata TaxID=74557 RepID=A0A1V9Z1E3_9STRA|nr:pyridoxal-dependent decarboxylase [Thraustotheca clavata]
MHPLLQHDKDSISELTTLTRDVALTFLNGLSELPPGRLESHNSNGSEAKEGIGAAQALEVFKAQWLPHLAASAGPRYLGFVTGGATPASLIGDWITSTVDQNPQSNWDSEAPELERETVKALASWFNLNSHQGSFVTGATMSNFVGLAIAREWVGELRSVKVSEDGIAALGAVNIYSACAHSSVYKAASMLGFGRKAIKSVPVKPGREAIDVEALEAVLAKDHTQGCIVVASLGTVNSGDFDDIVAIVNLKNKYNFWLHVDGAFGAFAALDQRYASFTSGIDDADSVCIDCHKWMNVPYDSALQFTRRRDLQVRVFQNAAAYLGEIGTNPNFVHLTPENSRRWRALAAWFAVTAYGRSGHADIVVRNVDCALKLGDLIESQLGEVCYLLAPVRLNVVLFTIRDHTDEASLMDLLYKLRASGETFMTPTYFEGKWGMRAAFSNWQTSLDDVDRVFSALKSAVLTK